MRILYSFGKRGFEAEFWNKEIGAASNDRHTFIPFNHHPYVDERLYRRAQLLDNLYYERHPGLMRLYADFEARLAADGIDAVIVDNAPPYHPDFLCHIPAYRVMRTTDGPVSAYDRDFAYLHAYHQVLFHSPAYSRDMGMAEKLAYCGAVNADWWPLGLFEAAYDPQLAEEEVLSKRRDIDVVFVGAMHLTKMPVLARIKKALGPRLRMHGLTSLKRNVYFNLKYGLPGLIRPLPFESYVPLYQRAKIGFNLHNRGDYTVGSYRLFELPANGVMQISDGGPHLQAFFEVGKEIERWSSVDDLIDKVRYYLDHEAERLAIALAGYRRVLRDYRMSDNLQRAASLIAGGMKRIGWKPAGGY